MREISRQNQCSRTTLHDLSGLASIVRSVHSHLHVVVCDFETPYPSADEAHFRELVVWLEDQKIRNYQIEQRAALRDITSDAWTAAFNKVRCTLGSFLIPTS